MISLMRVLMIAILLVETSFAAAGPSDDGFEAFDSGDYVTSLRLLKPLAEQGDIRAQNYLGIMYQGGNGVAQDFKSASFWFRKAAEQGDAFAQLKLGAMYGDGRGVPQDDKEALVWYRKSAEQGTNLARASLGRMYEDGRGVLQDYKEAVNWYRLSAEQGYPLSQYHLGMMYLNGRGMTRDNSRAHMWFNLAASNASGEIGKISRDRRDTVAHQMTSAQIAQAQDMARKCEQSKFKDCGW